MVHMHWRSCPSRAKCLENRSVPITVLHPIPHLRTSQTVSRNASNFTVALHRQEKPQQQSLTPEEASLTHQPMTNAHTQRTWIFYNFLEEKTKEKPTTKHKQTKPYLLVLDQNPALVNISETKFLLLKPADFLHAFTKKPVIRAKAFSRKIWQRNYMKPEPQDYICLICSQTLPSARSWMHRYVWKSLPDYPEGDYSKNIQ